MKKNSRVDINSVLFACYFYAVWAIYLFVNQYSYGGSKKVFLLSLLGMFVVTVPLAFLIIKLIRKIQIKIVELQCKRTVRIGLTMGYFGLNLFVLLFWFLAYFPGAFSPDSFSQYGQAISESYNDWHPFLHTFIFFTMPLELTGQPASIVLFQIIYFAVLLTYCSVSISRYFGVKVALITNAYIILNPYTGSIAMYPWKDVGFAMMVLFIATCMFNTYYSKNLWIRKPLNLGVLAIALVLCTIFRHNAVLYTFMVLVSLWCYCGKSVGVRATILTVALLIFIKGPVYSMFDVESPDRRHTETMGVPLTIMANVAKEGTDGLSEKTREFLFEIATQEEYKENYSTGNFNTIKWNGADTTIVDQTSIFEILSMTGECILKHPAYSAKAFFMLTDMVYALDGEIEGNVSPIIIGNDYGIEDKGNDGLKALLSNYKWVFTHSPLKFFCHIGSTVFFMLAFILGRCSFSSKLGWKKIFLCIPILVYDFGTMLLLTGSDSRFFFASFLVCPLVLLIALGEEQDKEEICK